MTEAVDREALCRTLGLTSVERVFEIVTQGAQGAPEHLLRKRLNAATLEKLGYDRKGMLRLGYSEAALAALGFGGTPAPAQGQGPRLSVPSRPVAEQRQSPRFSVPSAPGVPPGAKKANTPDADLFVTVGTPSIDDFRAPVTDEANAGEAGNAPPPGAEHFEGRVPTSQEIRDLVAQGHSAGELRQFGIQVSHCRAAGVDPRVLARIGFGLTDLVGEYSGQELRTLGFRPQELRRFYDGAQLRRFGYSAQEMRTAGFSVRDLLNFGYNQNHVVTAGYGTAELVREGLSLRTVDRKGFHNG